MDKFTKLTGAACPIDQTNLNTDQQPPPHRPTPPMTSRPRRKPAPLVTARMACPSSQKPYRSSGASAELPDEATARLSKWRAQQRHHVAHRQGPCGGGSSETCGAFRVKGLARKERYCCFCTTAQRHHPVSAMPSTELRRRSTGATVGGAQLRVPSCNDERLCHRSEDKQRRHAEIHALAVRQRARCYGAVSVRAVTNGMASKEDHR